MLTLSAVTYSISYLVQSQLEPFVDLPTLLVETMKDLTLSRVLSGYIPKSMKFELSEMTELRSKSIPQ